MSITKELIDTIARLTREKDEAEFRRDVAEWAVIGIAKSNLSITLENPTDFYL